MTATILELERELPRIRAHGFRAWQETSEAFDAAPDNPDSSSLSARRSGTGSCSSCSSTRGCASRRPASSRPSTCCAATSQTEASTTSYVKPSKFNRARVIPIGDGLGRVIAEIIRHVRRFYGSREVPACDNWDRHERRGLPRAPYLLQGAQHPSVIAPEHVRARLARPSRAAGLAEATARRSCFARTTAGASLPPSTSQRHAAACDPGRCSATRRSTP